MCLCAVRAADTPAAPPHTPPGEPKVGDFTTTFTERSPLSAPKEMARRLPRKEAIPDYDLSAEKFYVYVPKTYSPDVPAGIIVFQSYKAAHETPTTWHDMLDKHNLIFIVSENLPSAVSTRVGLSLDAIHNLQKQYKIDPTRIWTMGEEAATHLGFAYPDVFTAGIYRNHYYFRALKSKKPNTGSYMPGMPMPAAQFVSKSKTHPHILLQFKESNESSQLQPAAMAQDGFKHVLSLEVDKEPYHYPNFTTDWFEKIIEFIETSQKATVVAEPATPSLPATPPTSRAAVGAPPPAPANEPQKLLNLAKTYIAAKSYGPARARLQAIIDKYPNDPAAAEAKTLIQTLP
jgi:hypothetical protein